MFSLYEKTVRSARKIKDDFQDSQKKRKGVRLHFVLFRYIASPSCHKSARDDAVAVQKG